MSKVFIIAEAGVNHNGKEDLAFQLVDAAVAAGANAVKFQTFKAEALALENAPKAKYQYENTPKLESQQVMLKGLELSKSTYLSLSKYCSLKGIQFLSTAFDHESLFFLERELDMPLYKVASGEITNAPLLFDMAKFNKPIILSTGMANITEVEDALGIIALGITQPQAKPSLQSFKKAFTSNVGKKALRAKVSLLHCTSYYPAPVDTVNLLAMTTLGKSFGLPIGYSDHTLGTHIPVAAVANGASIIEKHITLDRSLPGPDHKASMTPKDFKIMVDQIRDTEKALGDGVKSPDVLELDTKNVARKSLVASRDLKMGEKITLDMIKVIRPGTGISPIYFWELEGKVLKKDICNGENIEI